MTLAGAADIGEKCLQEYAPKLKVRGIEEFSPNAQHEKQGIKAPLERIREDDIKEAVAKLLERIEGVGEFVTVIPPPKPANVDRQSKQVGDLLITFESGGTSEGEHVLWIYYHYRPK
jgi:hypothetical protein